MTIAIVHVCGAEIVLSDVLDPCYECPRCGYRYFTRPEADDSNRCPDCGLACKRIGTACPECREPISW